ncbi:hypothetical protein COBT_001095 [Conglomerata obtusa]
MIVTVVRTYIKNVEHIPNVYDVACASIYTNRINTKQVAYRFIYIFEKIKNEYIQIESKNNRYKIQLNIANFATYNITQRGLKILLEK